MIDAALTISRLSALSKTTDLFSKIIKRKIPYTIIGNTVGLFKLEASERLDCESSGVAINALFWYEQLEWLLAAEVFGLKSHTVFKLADYLYDQLTPSSRYPEAALVYEVATILERHRITSLWTKLYPGSAQEVQAVHLERLTCAFEANDSAVCTLRSVSAQVDLEGLDPQIVELAETALKMVEYADPKTLYLALKWFVSRLDRTEEATGRASAEYRNLFSGGTKGESLEDLLPQKNKDASDLINKSKSTAAQDLLRMKEKIAEAQSTKRGNTGNIKLAFNTEHAQAESHDPPNLINCTGLKKAFSHITGHKRPKLAISGCEIDMLSLIESKANPQISPKFIDESPHKGFSILILFDQSHSMRGEKIHNTFKALEILEQSLKLPKVSLECWGFQGGSDQVFLTKIKSCAYSTLARMPIPGGSTPLAESLSVAAAHMKAKRGNKYIFILTDGQPTSVLGSAEELITEEVRAVIHKTRKNHVKVVTGIIGEVHRGTTEVYYEIQTHQANRMFGYKKWSYLQANTLVKDMTNLVLSTLKG